MSFERRKRSGLLPHTTGRADEKHERSTKEARHVDPHMILHRSYCDGILIVLSTTSMRVHPWVYGICTVLSSIAVLSPRSAQAQEESEPADPGQETEPGSVPKNE